MRLICVGVVSKPHRSAAFAHDRAGIRYTPAVASPRSRPLPRLPVPFPVLLALAAIAGGWLVARNHQDDAPSPARGDARRAIAALSVPGARATVTRTVDGDTAVLRFRDKRGSATATVRYLGVDTPESVHPDKPVQCYGPQASHANRSWVQGHRVRLRFDRERVDPYGRILAALRPDGWRQSVSERLIAEGYARVLTIAPNGATAPRLKQLQRTAKQQRRGLWGACSGRD